MLQERFREFARDTGNIGQERVDTVNHMADELINSGHSDAATIAEWKDGLNEAWADLLELIDTRTQILAASYELHKFYCWKIILIIQTWGETGVPECPRSSNDRSPLTPFCLS